MRNELVRHLNTVQNHCSAADYSELKARVMRFLEPLPALDTPMGHREAIRRGIRILDGIHQAVLRHQQIPTSTAPTSVT
jgi:hypothetical protein